MPFGTVPPGCVRCYERRVDGVADAVKGAFPALNALNAPFTASHLP
jgi:hypothetical protein